MAANGPPADGDPVQLIYYYYEVARGLTDASPDQAAAAYAKILEYSAAAADKNARTLANSFIPDLFGSFAGRPELAARAVESMIDFCEDEDARLRVNTIRRLPDVAELSQSESDKELIVDILVQLLQAHAPAELQVVRSSLEKAAGKLPAVAARQLWALACSSADPVLQEIAIDWIKTSGRHVVAQSPEFADKGIAALSAVADPALLARLLPIVLGLATMKGPGSEPRLTALLDALVQHAPAADALARADQPALDYIAFLPRMALNLLARNASPSSLIKYLASTAVPLITAGQVAADATRVHVLRLAAESCSCTPASPEIDIFIPKLKDVVIFLAQEIDALKAAAAGDAEFHCKWQVLEPAAVALYLACTRAPSYPLSTDASSDLTPALRTIWAEAQRAVPEFRKRLAAAAPAERAKVEKDRLQCDNVLQVVKEMLKVPAVRSKSPLALAFSWRPQPKPKPAATASAPAPKQPDQKQGGKVNLKRRASAAEPAEKRARGNDRQRRGGGGRKRR